MAAKTESRQKPSDVKKQRIDLSDADFRRLEHISAVNALGNVTGRHNLGGACKFSINRQARDLKKKHQAWASRIDADEEKDLTPWGFDCEQPIRDKMEAMKAFYGLRYLSSVVRLAIRLQAAEDGFKATDSE